jgi:PBSX family phage terminase large subunit
MLSELSQKQLYSYQNSNSRINIWEGAVRSGKSFSCLIRWLKFIQQGPPGDLVVCGRTEDTIKRNIISPMIDLIGPAVSYRQGAREIKLWNRNIHVVSANDERAESKIRGSTFAGALVDEVTVLPENFFKMLLSRLSVTGAKLFCTTNPDSPFHWFKKDFIDNQEIDKSRFLFVLDDNPSLSEDFKANLKKEYSGLWKDRFIHGKWVLAEGTIFDYFDKELHTIDFPPGNADYYIVGIDYGTTNPCAFSLIGYSDRTYPNRWLEKEYYWDSKARMRQKTDTEYAQDLKNFIAGYRVQSIYLDPSAVSFRVELQRMGVQNIYEANNDVLDGIRYHSALISNGTFKICRNCKYAIEEYGTYRWDEKAAARGEDKPLKENDHCFVAGTLISTPLGDRPIETIKIGDEVLTRNGPKKVLATWESLYPKEVIDVDGTIVTPNHLYWTENRGKVPASELTHSDILFKIDGFSESRWIEKQSNGMEEHTIDIPMQRKEQKGFISESTGFSCTGTFGNSTMELSQKDIISTTKTEIQETTQSTIWNSYRLNFTFRNTKHKKEESGLKNMQKESDLFPKNGMHLKKGENGIKKMELEDGRNVLFNRDYAYTAEKNIKLNLIENLNSAPMPVSQHGEEKKRKTTNKESVKNVEPLSSSVDMRILRHALKAAPRSLDGRKEKVYNLTVEDEHEYFANGILVGNCMDSIRYALFTHFFQKDGRRLKPEDIDRMRNEVYGIETHGRFFDDRMW